LFLFFKAKIKDYVSRELPAMFPYLSLTFHHNELHCGMAYLFFTKSKKLNVCMCLGRQSTVVQENGLTL
jgi:hypothetical protein